MYLTESEYTPLKAAWAAAGLDCTETNYCLSNDYTCEQLSTRGDLKTLSILIDSTEYVLPPVSYCLDVTGDNNSFWYSYIPIVSQPDSEGHAMLGDTFMRNFYAVFNYEANTVSMAPNSANSWAPATVYSCTLNDTTSGNGCPTGSPCCKNNVCTISAACAASPVSCTKNDTLTDNSCPTTTPCCISDVCTVSTDCTPAPVTCTSSD
jgi:hypothetical protein